MNKLGPDDAELWAEHYDSMTTPYTNSPTPMTDAEEFLTGWQGNERHKVVKSAFARQLETKLQSALREVEELKRKVTSVIQRKIDNYDEEHGFTDPATGTREYPKGGEEYLAELEEIKEDLDNAMKEEK